MTLFLHDNTTIPMIGNHDDQVADNT